VTLRPHVADAEFLVQDLRRLRTEPFDRGEAQYVDGRLLAQPLEVSHAARVQQLDDPFGDPLANGGECVDPFHTLLCLDVGERPVECFHGKRRFLVGAGFEGYAVHLEEEGHLAQRVRHLGVGGRAPAASHR
jgi:hypothetical protein